MAEPRLVPVGRIVGVFGIKGWVKVFSDTDPPDNILSYSPWYVRREAHWQPLAVAEGQTHGKGILVRLEGCEDRDQAGQWVGCDIAVERSQLTDLPAGEYYWIDLVGLDVFNQQGIRLGNVSHLFATGSNDVVVVKDTNGKEQWIPYIPGRYVLAVDLPGRKMTVDWEPEGEADAV